MQIQIEVFSCANRFCTINSGNDLLEGWHYHMMDVFYSPRSLVCAPSYCTVAGNAASFLEVEMSFGAVVDG